MYAKLVFRNAKRSVKDYLVYIVTMTICVTLFYAFLSISSSYYSPDIGSEYDFTLLSDGMKIEPALRQAIRMADGVHAARRRAQPARRHRNRRVRDVHSNAFSFITLKGEEPCLEK